MIHFEYYLYSLSEPEDETDINWSDIDREFKLAYSTSRKIMHNILYHILLHYIMLLFE